MNRGREACFAAAIAVAISATTVAAVWPAAAAAQTLPESPPENIGKDAPRGVSQDTGAIHLEADSIRYDKNTGRSIYQGNVVVHRDDVRLTGDEVEVFSEDGEISRITARATPSTFESRTEDGLVRAEADRVEYDVKRRVIVFLGGARVDDGEKVLRGGRIVYDLEKRIVDATKSEGRVRLTIDP